MKTKSYSENVHKFKTCEDSKFKKAINNTIISRITLKDILCLPLDFTKEIQSKYGVDIIIGPC